MKKLCVTLLVAGLSLSVISCGSNKDSKENQTTSPSTVTTESNETNSTTGQAGTNNTNQSGSNTATPDQETNTNEVTPSDASGSEAESDTNTSTNQSTLGASLREQFFEEANNNPQITASQMADALITNKALGKDFSAMTMEVKPGLLNGFDNAEITGFSDGVQFAPMIGSIPFVGYVFTLEDQTDAESFVKNLKDNANPAWNICTEADETVVEQAGNLVLFVMCPSSLE